LSTLSLNDAQSFHQRSDWFDDDELVRCASACIKAQRQAAAAARRSFAPCPDAETRVAPSALEKILAAGRDINGIATDRSISNVISFNANNIEDAVNSKQVMQLRREVDARVDEKLRSAFEGGNKLSITSSGHFWYPPGGYMGWHTNNGLPGWRIYLTHATEPGQSFFRYRDPASGQIITSTDHQWDVRLFKIDPNVVLWHAVYSQTDRFSLGYLVYPKRPLHAVAGKIKRLLRPRSQY